MYKIFVNIGDEHESAFLKCKTKRDNQLKGDPAALYMYMTVKMTELFNFSKKILKKLSVVWDLNYH